ncbi:MAG: hypothetical protein JKY54_00130, partial [Flavobacteriales bacterium]|nr:hypothetical protein [Flavobacteriales bacterium]
MALRLITSFLLISMLIGLHSCKRKLPPYQDDYGSVNNNFELIGISWTNLGSANGRIDELLAPSSSHVLKVVGNFTVINTTTMDYSGYLWYDSGNFSDHSGYLSQGGFNDIAQF